MSFAARPMPLARVVEVVLVDAWPRSGFALLALFVQSRSGLFKFRGFAIAEIPSDAPMNLMRFCPSVIFSGSESGGA